MRDLRGYANRLPDVRWPNGANVAVSFVVNFEEGAEYTITDGDERNESVYEVVAGRPDADPCIDSHFEYATRVGWWRLADCFAEHRACFTLSSCGRAVERSPWLAQDAVARGHEVSAHGYRWEEHAGMEEDAERASIAATVTSIERATGRRPVGWHTRSASSAHTRRLLVEAGFLYDSDAYNDDTPYYVLVGDRRHLVLPYAFDSNDMQFQHTQRFSTGGEFAEYVCDAYDWLAKEGQRMPRMLSIGLHLRMIARPGRMKSVQTILRHMAAQGGAWIATREQIARHWIEHTPK